MGKALYRLDHSYSVQSVSDPSFADAPGAFQDESLPHWAPRSLRMSIVCFMMSIYTFVCKPNPPPRHHCSMSSSRARQARGTHIPMHLVVIRRNIPRHSFTACWRMRMRMKVVNFLVKSPSLGRPFLFS